MIDIDSLLKKVSPSYTPTVATPTTSGQQATLSSPDNKYKVVVTSGSSQASQLMKAGWSLGASGKTEATLDSALSGSPEPVYVAPTYSAPTYTPVTQPTQTAQQLSIGSMLQGGSINTGASLQGSSSIASLLSGVDTSKTKIGVSSTTPTQANIPVVSEPNIQPEITETIGAPPRTEPLTQEKSFVDNLLSKVQAVGSLISKPAEIMAKEFATTVTEDFDYWKKTLQNGETPYSLKEIEKSYKEGFTKPISAGIEIGLAQNAAAAYVIAQASLEVSAQLNKAINVNYDSTWADNLANKFSDIVKEAEPGLKQIAEEAGQDLSKGAFTLPNFLIGTASGGVSLATGVGMGAALKSVSAAAATLTMVESSQKYQDALNVGKTPVEAFLIAMKEGIVTYALEKVGFEVMFKNFGGGKVANTVIKSVSETVQESAQTVWQNFSTKWDIDKSQSLWEGLVETIIQTLPLGAIGGGTISNIQEHTDYFDNLSKHTEIPKADLIDLTEKIVVEVNKKTDIIKQAEGGYTEAPKMVIPKVVKPTVTEPATPQVKETLPTETVEILRGTKGMTADDIMKTYPNIQLKRDVPAKNIHGNKVEIEAGIKLTPAVRNRIKGKAPVIKTSGKMTEIVEKPAKIKPVEKNKIDYKKIENIKSELTKIGEEYKGKELPKKIENRYNSLLDEWQQEINKAQETPKIKPVQAPVSDLKVEKVEVATPKEKAGEIKTEPKDFNSFVENMFADVDKTEAKEPILSEIDKIQQQEIKKIEKELGDKYDIAGMEDQYDNFISLLKQPKLRNKNIREQLETGDADRFRKIISESGLMTGEQLDNLLWNQDLSDSNVYDIFIAKATKELSPELTKERLQSRQTRIKKIKEIEVPRSQIPVGEGKTKVSRLEARMKNTLDNLSQDQIDKLGLSIYQEMNNPETIAKASEYVINNPKEALEVLEGKKEAPPNIPRNAIYVAMANNQSLSAERALKVASVSSTRFGQEIEILKELNKDTAVSKLQEVYKVVEEKVKTRLKGKTQAKAKAELKNTLENKTKTAKAKIDWVSFVDSIKC